MLADRVCTFQPALASGLDLPGLDLPGLNLSFVRLEFYQVLTCQFFVFDALWPRGGMSFGSRSIFFLMMGSSDVVPVSVDIVMMGTSMGYMMVTDNVSGPGLHINSLVTRPSTIVGIRKIGRANFLVRVQTVISQ